MSGEAMKHVVGVRGLTCGKRNVLWTIAWNVKPDQGHSWLISQKDLAICCDIEERNIRNHLRELEEEKHIWREVEGTGRGAVQRIHYLFKGVDAANNPGFTVGEPRKASPQPGLPLAAVVEGGPEGPNPNRIMPAVGVDFEWREVGLDVQIPFEIGLEKAFRVADWYAARPQIKRIMGRIIDSGKRVDLDEETLKQGEEALKRRRMINELKSGRGA